MLAYESRSAKNAAVVRQLLDAQTGETSKDKVKCSNQCSPQVPSRPSLWDGKFRDQPAGIGCEGGAHLANEICNFVLAQTVEKKMCDDEVVLGG